MALIFNTDQRHHPYLDHIRMQCQRIIHPTRGPCDLGLVISGKHLSSNGNYFYPKNVRNLKVQIARPPPNRTHRFCSPAKQTARRKKQKTTEIDCTKIYGGFSFITYTWSWSSKSNVRSLNNGIKSSDQRWSIYAIVVAYAKQEESEKKKSTYNSPVAKPPKSMT